MNANRKYHDSICWTTVEFNLVEAVRELENLLERVSDRVKQDDSGDVTQAFDRDLTEGGLAIQLSHAYHHLNSAWNARRRPMPEADRTFHRNELWPRAAHFKKFWPRKGVEKMKKISTVFAVGIVMFTLAGCVPGETVVTISADDVGCVMTGGVGRAEVVTTLKSSIPKFDLSKMSKPAFEQFDLPKMPKSTLERFDRSRMSKLALEQFGLSATNTALEAVQKVLKETECIYSAFLPKGDSVKLSAKEEGTNIFLFAHIKRNAMFIADSKNLSAERADDLFLYIDEKEGLKIADSTSQKQFEQTEVVAGILGSYIHLAFDNKEFSESLAWGFYTLRNPFFAMSKKIRIVGEGADKFKVEGLRIVPLRR